MTTQRFVRTSHLSTLKARLLGGSLMTAGLFAAVGAVIYGGENSVDASVEATSPVSLSEAAIDEADAPRRLVDLIVDQDTSATASVQTAVYHATAEEMSSPRILLVDDARPSIEASDEVVWLTGNLRVLSGEAE